MKRIDIPSFDDFLADMGEDGVKRWSDAIDGLPLGEKSDSLEDWLKTYSMNIIKASHLFSVEMLRDYHEWLIDKLSAKSVRLL